MGKIDNLWPSDIGGAKITPPKNILFQQAEYFNEMMKMTLVAGVSTVQAPDHQNRNCIVHEFIIKAPTLGNYNLVICRLIHYFNLYPLNVYNAIEDVSYSDIPNEEVLLKTLKRIFNSEKVIYAIASLKAQL